MLESIGYILCVQSRFKRLMEMGKDAGSTDVNRIVVHESSTLMKMKERLYDLCDNEIFHRYSAILLSVFLFNTFCNYF